MGNMVRGKISLIRTVIGALLAAAVIFTCVPFTLYADDDDFVADPTGKREGYAAFLYNNTTGLPTSEANAITETSDGFIWIGSYGGLIRYDGNTFERMDSTTGIASVVSLFVDSTDRLWIGTNDSGAACMDREGNIEMFGKSDGLPASSVRSFSEDDAGNIYVATTQGVALIDPDGSISFLDDPRINDEYVRRLDKGADGVIYGLTMNGDLLTFENGSLTGFYSSSDTGIEDVHAFAVDPENPGYIYLGTKGTEIYYGSLQTGFPSEDVIDVEPLEYINALKPMGGDLWVCANNGVGVYKHGKLELLENVPMTSNIEGVTSDYQGNLWFVSSRQGVMKIVPDMFTDVFEQYGLEETVVNTTCYFNNLLIIGRDNGLTAINRVGVAPSFPLMSCFTASGTDLHQSDMITMLDGIRIRSIVADSQDRLWFSTYGDYALVRYDHGRAVCFTPEDGMPSDRIRTVFEREDGTVMVACTGGVVIIDGDEITQVYDESSGMSNTEVLTVADGENGDILVGTDGDGIYVMNDGQVVRELSTDEGLTSEVVMRIKKDVNLDVYWIVTSNSIAYMTSDYEITTIEKFPYSNNFDLYENSQGEVWILSSNGIYVATAEELMENGDIDPVYYGFANGLPVIATSNSYSSVTDEGVLYIAGSTGVAKVNIEEPFETVDDIKMTVPYIEADGVRYYPDETGTINVPSDVKKITIYPYVCTYSLMDPTVTYTLEGFGSTTLRRSEMSPVDYTNLGGGSYKFTMVISDSMGHGSNEFSITIVKQKSIFEQTWFRLLMSALFILLIAEIVILYAKHKTRALLKKQEENKMFTREIVEAFARTIDMKDKYTNGHSTRVAEYTVMLAKELGYDEDTVEKYYDIALLHDIGKIGVPGEVLNKQGRLDDDEFAAIKSHTTLGYNVLKDISIMPELSTGAKYHHERPDGRGYPSGLKGDEIPRAAQIIAVADAFDAMYSNRPYRGRMNFDKVVNIITEASGTQLTADVVDAFLRIVARGGFRAPDDVGGGSTEDIDNIHKKFHMGDGDDPEKK